MDPNGRTMKQARDAGNFFCLDAPDGRSFEYPAAETIEDSLECIRDNIRRGWARPIPAGTELRAYRHLPPSRIGAAVLEFVEVVTF